MEIWKESRLGHRPSRYTRHSFCPGPSLVMHEWRQLLGAQQKYVYSYLTVLLSQRRANLLQRSSAGLVDLIPNHKETAAISAG